MSTPKSLNFSSCQLIFYRILFKYFVPKLKTFKRNPSGVENKHTFKVILILLLIITCNPTEIYYTEKNWTQLNMNTNTINSISHPS